MSQSKPGGFLDFVKTILYAGLIAIGVRSVAYEPFNIPSGSMIPTLLIGDYLFVSKASYGYSKYSFPFSPDIMSGRIFLEKPQRGDVAVFKLPTNPSIDYIKRIVGMPGDRIQVKGGVLHINDEAVKRERIDDFVNLDHWGNKQRFAQYIETLPNGEAHKIIEATDNGPLDQTSVYHVPEGHYFAMGDNRDNSQDSRVLSAVGFIPEENLVGRADFLFFSTDGSTRFWEFWNWPFATRFERLFTGIN
ncbi:MAG: signal peptidase I [Alphaproteobacteria bacterium]|nr:signal peptidase I [Rhodospirillales bacterium]MCW9045883.1 signal peptidase I [Alphaproteobacteria bacterium]